MNRSLFQVPKMDCAAEENLVRLKLDELGAVRSLDFNLSARNVTVYHEGQPNEIEHALGQLGFSSKLLETEQTYAAIPEHAQQRRLLWAVLLINFVFFVLEMTTGFISGSMGLVADSLDMLADALVYGLSLFAIGTTVVQKKNVAKWSGYFQIVLAVLGFTEAVRRFIGTEALPDFRTMIIVALLALIANGVCLYLLQRSKDREAHIQASMIFTSNDVLINLGVIVAGVLVLWLGSSLPDLIISAVVFVIVSLGAVRILRLAR